MAKLLSILIPTLPSRISTYARLINKIYGQIQRFNLQDEVQILSLMDTKDIILGKKRNKLVEMALGKYIMFIDDDDDVSDNFLLKIIEGTKSGNDVITFNGEYHENGSVHSDFIISTLVVCDTNSGGIMYRRPNHLCAVRREIAIDCKFPDKNFREDSDYSELINKHIKTEFHINEKLYFYLFDKSTTETHS